MIERRTFLTGASALALATPAMAQTAPPATTPPAAAAPATAAGPPPLPPVPAGAVRIVMNTGAGPITVDLFADKAPITCANFLRYIDRKMYDGGQFYRAVKVVDDPLYGLMQGGISKALQPLAGIAHESTAKTGIHHLDGTISMARGALGTAKSDFFMCVGDASVGLDAGDASGGDKQGFAAFGRVAGGMETVRKMLVMPTSATLGPPGMKGTFLASPVPIRSMRRV